MRVPKATFVVEEDRLMWDLTAQVARSSTSRAMGSS
jgi:hypothetical protein